MQHSKSGLTTAQTDVAYAYAVIEFNIIGVRLLAVWMVER